MNSKRWFKLWMLIVAIAIPVIISVNYLIDPLTLNGNKIINFKKIVVSVRANKVELASKLSSIDNVILGSSRAKRISPKHISKYLEGETFNFAVNSALPEDNYGILLYLERNNKIPKNIIMGVDFYTLNKLIPSDKRFLSNKELNFLNKTSNATSIIDYLSFDMLKHSFKTIYHGLKGTVDSTKINPKNGFLYETRNDILISKGKFNYAKKIKSESQKYFNGKYSAGNYSEFSKERIEYLKKIKQYSSYHNINLYVYLSPSHCSHLKKIKRHKGLNKTLEKFKQYMSNNFNYVDFMIDNDKNCNDKNFYDAVHISPYLANLIVDDLFNKTKVYGIDMPLNQ